MKGLSSLVAAIMFIFLILLSSITLYAYSFLSDTETQFVNNIGKGAKEELLITTGIIGFRIYNLGPSDVVVPMIMIVDSTGVVVGICTSIEITIPSHESVVVYWSDLGLDAPPEGGKIIVSTKNGKVFGYRVYKIPRMNALRLYGNISLGAGQPLLPMIYIGGNINSGNLNGVIGSNLDIPINPVEIYVNGTRIALDFSKGYVENTTVRYVESLEKENETEHGNSALVFEDIKYGYMNVSNAVFFTDEGLRTLVNLVLDNYILNSTNVEPDDDSNSADVNVVGYVFLEIRGLLGDGTPFVYFGQFDVFIKVVSGGNSNNVMNFYLQPSGIVEIDD
jgi:hypothetical protein